MRAREMVSRAKDVVAALHARTAAIGRQGGAYQASLFTRGAPHVRDAMSLDRMRAIQVGALMPALLIGLWNVGRQVAAVAAANGSGMAGVIAGPTTAGGTLDPAMDVWAATAIGLRWYLPVLVVAVVSGGACQSVFAWMRGRPASRGLLLTALLFTLALPPTITLWKVAFGIAFGLAVGQEIFGGPGRGFVNPALVGLVFLYFAYPDALRGDGIWVPGGVGTASTALARARVGGIDSLTLHGPTWFEAFCGAQLGGFGDTSLLACALGAVLLVSMRIIAWRVVVGGIAGLIGASLLAGMLGAGKVGLAGVPWYWQPSLGSFAFVLVFVATDPVTTPTTARGRWIYGTLIGALTLLVRVASTTHTEGVMLAVLLGNTAAPLLDHFAVERYASRARGRTRRHG